MCFTNDINYILNNSQGDTLETETRLFHDILVSASALATNESPNLG